MADARILFLEISIKHIFLYVFYMLIYLEPTVTVGPVKGPNMLLEMNENLLSLQTPFRIMSQFVMSAHIPIVRAITCLATIDK